MFPKVHPTYRTRGLNSRLLTPTCKRFLVEELEGRIVPSTFSPDFNNDGFADLAVGVPNENNGAGAVQVFYGSSTGVRTGGQQFITQNSTGVAGDEAADDNFGQTLVWGDFNNDGFDDLAIGVPDESDVNADGTAAGDVDDGGVVQIFYGTAGV